MYCKAIQFKAKSGGSRNLRQNIVYVSPSSKTIVISLSYHRQSLRMTKLVNIYQNKEVTTIDWIHCLRSIALSYWYIKMLNLTSVIHSCHLEFLYNVPVGIRRDEGYNVVKCIGHVLWSCLWGRSTEWHYLGEKHTDVAFCVLLLTTMLFDHYGAKFIIQTSLDRCIRWQTDYSKILAHPQCDSVNLPANNK